MEGYNKKKLSAMVAVALGFGMAFGVAPADVAQAADMTVNTLDNGKYDVTVGTSTTQTVSLPEMLEIFTANASEENSIITLDKSAGTAVAEQPFVLGKNVTLNVQNSTSSATVKGGDTASTLTVSGTNVTGENVNLASVDIKDGGRNTIRTNLSGTVGELTTSGNGTVSMEKGDLIVDTLEVNTNLIVNDTVKVEAKNVTVSESATLAATGDNSLKTETLTVSGTIDSGTKINAETVVVDGGTLAADTTVNATSLVVNSGSTISEGTKVKTETLVVNEGATVAKGTTVEADKVEVAATATDTLTNLTITSSTGSSVEVSVKLDDNASAEEIATAKKAAEDAIAANEANKSTVVAVKTDSTTKVTANGDGTYNVGQTKNVSEEDLKTTVAKAYESGASTIVLDKESTKKLQSAIAIPAGKTMVVSDGTEKVTVTAGSANANVVLDGTTIKSADTKLAKIEVDAGKTTVTAVESLKVDTVVVTSGNVKATDVEATDFTVNGGSVVTDKVTADNFTVSGEDADVTAKNVDTTNFTVNGGTVATENVTANGAFTANGGTVTAANVKADTVTVNSGTTLKTDGTIEANTVAINGGTITKDEGTGSVTVKATKVAVSDTSKLAGVTLEATDGKTLTVTKANGEELSEAEAKAVASSVSQGTKITDSKGTTIATGSKEETKGDASSKGDTDKGDTDKGDTDKGDTDKGDTDKGDTDKGDTDKGDTDKELTTAEKKNVDAAKELAGKVDDFKKVDLTTPLDELNKQTAEVKNPFTQKLPKAADIANAEAKITAYNEKVQDLLDKKAEIADSISALQNMDATQVESYAGQSRDTLVSKLGEAQDAIIAAKPSLLGESDVAKYQAAAQNAVIKAGKTVAAPSMTGMRSATAISGALAENVVKRTSDLRSVGFASATDDGGVEHAWFQISHSDMDVDNGDVYGKSTVKLTNYQLGYDAQVSKNDYLGGFIGHTAGSADFTGTVNGSIDVKNSINYGVYGTHVLPKGQYLDYMVYGGRFDNKYAGKTWGTNSFGVMTGYGVKIASSESLTVNPYIQFAYDRISVDDVTFASGNTVKSDTANNFGVKVGVNLFSAGGFYGGTAYSRGLSGDYRSTVNGIYMPSSDNDTNVVYLNLGYRANITANTMLDLSVEKTFVDYDGWKATGKYNIYF